MTEQVSLTGQLKHYFGFDSFKGDQEAIIRNLMEGHDIFVLMPTGGGKSLCYQLPSLIMEGTAIVISPLIALMKNQVDVINGLSESDGVAHYLNSSLNKSAIEKVKSDILSGKTKLLYVAPESLTKEDNVEFLKTIKISFYAVDEAHCISEWGHDFRPEYRRIRPIVNEIGQAPVIALTATATDKVRTDIKKNLGILDALEYKSSFNRPNLYYEVRQKTNDVDRQIIKFIRQHPGKSGIIYCLSRKKVEELAEVLKANEIKAGELVLSPTRTYAPVIKKILDELRPEVHGMVHCTGGAQTKVLHFVGENCKVVKDNMFPVPPLFKAIHDCSETDWKEMYQVFNMGHRMEIYVRPEVAEKVIAISKSFNIDAQIVGHIEEGKRSLTIKSEFGTFEY